MLFLFSHPSHTPLFPWGPPLHPPSTHAGPMMQTHMGSTFLAPLSDPAHSLPGDRLCTLAVLCCFPQTRTPPFSDAEALSLLTLEPHIPTLLTVTPLPLLHCHFGHTSRTLASPRTASLSAFHPLTPFSQPLPISILSSSVSPPAHAPSPVLSRLPGSVFFPFITHTRHCCILLGFLLIPGLRLTFPPAPENSAPSSLHTRPSHVPTCAWAALPFLSLTPSGVPPRSAHQASSLLVSP